LTGGVYISGDVRSIKFEALGGNCVTTIDTGRGVTRIVECLASGYKAGTVGETVVESGAAIQVYSNLPNGAIFATGDIRSLSGTYAGRHTVAADVSRDKSVYVTDNVVREGDTSSSCLGIVGANVYIGDRAPSNLSIYAAIYAGRKTDKRPSGSFTLQNMGMLRDARPDPTLDIHGGICEAVLGGTGTISGDHHTGYVHTSISFEPSLETNPPPYFPAYGKLRMTYYDERTM
jgi:hypothetical protein